MDERADPELVAAIARGDELAFATFYGRHLPLVLRWCLRETGNRELAADLCAEVFAASLIAARRYRPDRGEVLAWLLGIARNKLRESRRREMVEDRARRRMGIEPAELTDDDLDRVVELASIDAGPLWALVEALPEDLRRPLLDRVIAERPYAEIAAELCCSELVVRQRVSRGLRRLRSYMEEPQ
ncbi:MAG: RNA polymerase sigma factor [Trebonia sp.]